MLIREDVEAAAAVLRGAGDGEPGLLLTLTDEQIAGLDGTGRAQFVAEPWLAEHAPAERSEQRELVARAGVRALLAAERIYEVIDPATGRPRLQAEPAIAGCLLLRRTAATFTTAERTVQSDHGPEVHRLHHYVHPDGVLEEEVTPSGLHRFTPLREEQAAARLAVVLDREGAAGRGGGAGAPEDQVLVRESELAGGHPLAARLAAARAPWCSPRCAPTTGRCGRSASRRAGTRCCSWRPRTPPPRIRRSRRARWMPTRCALSRSRLSPASEPGPRPPPTTGSGRHRLETFRGSPA